MAYRLQVSCIVQASGKGPNAYIEAIGGETKDGSSWLVSQQEAIKGMEHARWLFFIVDRQGMEHELEIASTAEGKRYLKAAGDAEVPKLLLGLKRCPSC